MHHDFLSPLRPPNHGPKSKKTSTVPGALVAARAGCRWLTAEYARPMSSVRHSRKAADGKRMPIVPQFATVSLTSASWSFGPSWECN